MTSNTPPHHDAPAALTHTGPTGARMVDIASKPITPRQATAEALVPIGQELHRLIVERTHKKGDVLTIAQIAGIAAVKHTATVIPLCHPLPIDAVDVNLELTPTGVRITATVRTTWKTGVEMEALHAATTAALTIIDMGKAVQRGLEIQHVRLLHKTGGQHGDYHAPQEHTTPVAIGNAAQPTHQRASVAVPLRFAVLTVSDRAAQGAYADRGGPAVREWLDTHMAGHVVHHAVVPDEPALIIDQLRAWASEQPTIDAVFTTGGTGLSSRDQTPEATLAVLDRRYDGLLELARQRCAQLHVKAYLSRGIAGVAQRTLIVNLPGSPTGAIEVLQAIRDVLPHALGTLRGDPDACPSSSNATRPNA